MPFTFTMPKLSPTMETGTLVKWHKKIGEYVNVGDLVIEVATDKATVEHEAMDAGWLRKIIVPEGGSADVNEPLAIFTEEEKESIEGYALPKVAAKQEIASPEKVKIEKPQPQSQAIASEQVYIAPAQASNTDRILASPLAKKLAKEQGLNLVGVKGSGPAGRIMKRDLAHAKQLSGGVRQRHFQHPAGTFVETALTPMRKVIAQRLQEAKSTIPHFYVQQSVDAEPIISLRNQLKNFEIDVTFNDLMIKAIALTLKAYPEVNCGFDPKKNVLLHYKTIDISVAVSIEGGLITPIVTHADVKHVTEISAEVKSLVKKAKEGKLEPKEYQGGSFTVSNMGMYGVDDFQAIINPPQAAILAVSGIRETPVVKNGVVVPGKLLGLSLSVDHRAIDGSTAAKFMKKLQKHLENPSILLLD